MSASAPSISRRVTSSLRIAVASSGLGCIARGVESWSADLAAALADRGENVTLFKGGGEVQAPYERIINCWPRLAPRTQRLVRWMPRGAWRLGIGSDYEIEQTTFALKLLPILRRERFDVLHVQDPLL